MKHISSTAIMPSSCLELWRITQERIQYILTINVHLKKYVEMVCDDAELNTKYVG